MVPKDAYTAYFNNNDNNNIIVTIIETANINNIILTIIIVTHFNYNHYNNNLRKRIRVNWLFMKDGEKDAISSCEPSRKTRFTMSLPM